MDEGRENSSSRAKSRPTVKEVAARCGVSNATVSRVLNNDYRHGFSVTNQLRQRIAAVADELGYRPNLAAKNLVRRRTQMVGIVGSDIIFGWPGNLYQTVIDASVRLFHENDFDVCINVPNLRDDDIELPSWRIDAAVVLQECSASTIEAIERTRLPYVVVNGVGGPNCSSVIPDDVQGTRRAISYLLDLGHQRIAYAGPTLEHKKHRSVTDRHDTYLAVLAEHGLEPIPGHAKMFTSAPAFLASAVLRHHATAILAYDHIEAIKLLQGAHTLDLQIPRNFSLMCFNDEYLCSIVTPPLTTIAVPARQMGHAAARMILEHLKAPQDYHPEHKTLSQDLVVRSSTAPLN
jgi:DNA-binding LacI/PurR family transcriptional regulator